MISNCLILHTDYEDNADTISKHYKSFENYGSIYYQRINLIKFNKIKNDELLEKFDAIIIHYSIYLPTLIAKKNTNAFNNLKNFNGQKILFIQDEYRHINKTNNLILLFGINCIYSVCSKKSANEIYKESIKKGILVKETLTGYIDEFNDNENDFKYLKTIDVSYRGRDLTNDFRYLGKKAFEKSKISKIKSDLKKNGFTVNISTKEKDRLYGSEWKDLLKKSKATLITISGASVCDFTGDIYKNFHKLYDLGYRGKLLDATFSKYDGLIEATAISPRVFEATYYKNLLIGYVDNYSNILKAGIHYVALKRDHSNLNEIFNILRNKELTEKYIKNSFNDLIRSNKFTWKRFVQDFEIDQNCSGGNINNDLKIEFKNYLRENMHINSEDIKYFLIKKIKKILPFFIQIIVINLCKQIKVLNHRIKFLIQRIYKKII